MRKVFLVNHKEMQCGVHEYGLNVYENIRNSKKFNVLYIEVEDHTEFVQHLEEHPDLYAVIYNYYPSTMSWLKQKDLDQRSKFCRQFIIVHETGTPEVDGYIHIDPSFEEYDNHFKTVRPLLKYEGEYPKNGVFTVGSFGFGFGNKGFPEVIQKVNEEYDEALIRFRIPFATFGDSNGNSARSIANICNNIPRKPGINLEISHDFLETNQLLEFLASNDANAYFYHLSYGRGPSSVIDYSLSVKRPIVLTKSYQFKHLYDYPIFIEDRSMREIIERGTQTLEPLYEAWSGDNLIKDYEKILESDIR
jgi:hypothetical protein